MYNIESKTLHVLLSIYMYIVHDIVYIDMTMHIISNSVYRINTQDCMCTFSSAEVNTVLSGDGSWSKMASSTVS